MSDFKLNIDADQIKGMVAEGILAQLTDELRADILKQAVAHVLAPPARGQHNYYGTQETPLQAAFNQAASLAVRDVVRDMTLNDTEFQDRIRAAVSETVLAATATDFDLEQMVSKALADTLLEAWRSKRE